jgi:hypothetical protein
MPTPRGYTQLAASADAAARLHALSQKTLRHAAHHARSQQARRAHTLSMWCASPQILFHITMMALQNFGFFIMYFAIWLATPEAEVCAETRFAEGFMALTCFLVAFLCIGMGFGGYTDDPVIFALYWIAHAVPAVGGYTTCTFLVPIARFSDTGAACAALATVPGSAVQAVYVVHAGLYWCYVGNMVSVTYFSFLKPTFGFTVKPAVAIGLLVLVEALVFGKLADIGAFAPLPTPEPKAKLFGIF